MQLLDPCHGAGQFVLDLANHVAAFFADAGINLGPLLARNEQTVWFAGNRERKSLRGDRGANPPLDGLDRDKRNVIVPEHRAVAAGAHQLVFGHPHARAQRGNCRATERNLSHARRLTYGAVTRNAPLRARPMEVI
jgi:hypothetical protein